MASALSFAAVQSSLHIGDTVLFLIKTREGNGYVYSELSSSPYNFLTVYIIQSDSIDNEKEAQFPNVAYATFKVLAPNKYKAKQHFRELEQRKGVEEYEILNAKRAVEVEDTENSLEQQRRYGTKVVYGDLIQLQHIASKKFVKVCSEASKTESSNLLVNLSDENAEGCIFKILPRYKVRSEGDEVRFGDQLKIESIKTQGQFLHCSSGNLKRSKFNVLLECHELNLSATESALTLVSHYSPLPKHPSKALRAGGCVRLFHKEDECYIVAEGSFAEANPIIEDVHCRMRRVDSRKHAAPSTSANTYWQIEKQEDPRSGDIISWGERCRIKHLPTRLYLAVIKDGDKRVVTLKERSNDGPDLETLFSFHPLIEEGDEVLLESYACIKHLVSGQWLHLEKKTHYTRKNFDPTAKGLAGLQWDSAELYMLSTSKDRGDYDSYTLQEVTEDLLDSFNYVAGIVPVLSAYIQKLISGVDVEQKHSVRVRDTLIDLGKWLVTDHDRDTKNNQKLLRNLRIIEQLSEILKHADHFENSHQYVAIARECYNVIKKYLEGDSRKNENYLARFIEFFQTQMRKGLNAEEVLVEIVQDNLTIVSKMADTQMSYMIEQFCKTEDPRFLHFLSSLCVCAGRPIPSTQDRLMKELVLDQGKNIFLRTKIQKNADNEDRVYVYEPTSDQVTSIRKLKPVLTNNRTLTFSRRRGTKDSNQVKDKYELFEAQLHLLAKLCKGNNRAAIEALVHTAENNGYISFDEALLCAKDTELDTTLRSRYVELLLVMFVDVGENRPFLDHLCYSFIYDDLIATPYSDTGDEETIALTGVENLHFPALKIWILETVQANTKLCCDMDNTQKNLLLEQILDVLGYLVRYGYYDDVADINEVMVPLIQLLDGETDVPSPSITESAIDLKEFKSSGRKEDAPENKAVFAVKCKALEVMELFYRFKFYVNLQKFMYDFKVLVGNGRRTVTNSGKESLNNPPQALIPLIKADTEHPQNWIFSPQMISCVRQRIKYLCGGNVKGSDFAPPNDSIPQLEEVLLDLSSYDCDELVTSSLDLLTRMYFFEEELFNKARQGQLLTAPKSLQDYKEVNIKILPELRQLLRVDTNRENQERIVELMQRLQELCLLPFTAGSGAHPNKQNQIMMDNFGLVSEIVSFVLTKGDQGLQKGSDPSTEITGTSIAVGEEVFRECFCLLRYIAADNKSVQKRLFNRINDLLAIKMPTLALADLADLLTEVFTGGPELILKVTEAHVERIFEIIVDCENATVQAQFMVTLEAMAKIEELDLPVGRNQALIVKNFCRLRDAFCQNILGETPDMEEKRKILLNSETDVPDPQLQLLLSVTDMLAACAEGKNLFIESVCQNILSIEELVRIMSSHLPPAHKRPFVRFLIWVYMNTEGDRENTQGSALTHGEVMWVYLEHLSGLLENIARVLSLVSSAEMDNIRNELTTSNRRRTSFSVHSPVAHSGGSRLPRSSSVGVPDVTDENGQIIPGLLEYLADGVIPLLHTYYSYFFDPESTNKEEQKQREFDVSGHIAKSLMLLGHELVKVFSNESYIQKYQDTVNKLLAYEEIQIIANIDEEQTQTVQEAIKTAPPKSCSRRKTLERTLTVESQAEEGVEHALENYERQRNLNDDFTNYSCNYCYCYMGPNTARHQIASPVNDIEYYDEGEELPLGPSFQNLVAIYIDPLASHELKVKIYAERLLKQLEVSFRRTEQLGEAEQVNQDILDIRCLQVLRALIHNQIKLIDPELKDRDPIKFRQKSDELVVPVQNRIQRFNNAIQRVIPLLSHPNECISRESLALMKALLFSGNEETQEGLALDLKETREETLFFNFKERLEIASLNYKETIDLESQLASRQEAKIRMVIESAQTGGDQPALEPIVRIHGGTFNRDTQPVAFSTGKEVAISMEVLNAQDQDDQPLITRSTTSLKHPNTKGTSFESDPSEQVETLLKETIAEESAHLSQLVASDTSWTTLVLEVIGLMCDGQHRTLQDYLREQPDNFKTVNVVAEVTTFLHTYTSDLTRDHLGQIHQIIQALIEMSVGNVQNQQVIFDKLIVDPLNRILQLPLGNSHTNCHFNETVTDKCPQCSRLLDIIQIKGSAIELLDVMLEETSHKTNAIAHGIGSSLDVKAVILTMKLFHDLQSHPLVRKKQMDDDCERGQYKAHHAIIALIDYGAIELKNLKEYKKKAECLESKDIYNDSSQHSRTIEIHYEQEGTKPVLAQVHFPYDSKNDLREEITEVVRWNINRDSMEDKQRALLDLMPALKRDILHQAKLKDTKILKPFLAFHTVRIRLLMLLTLILNLFILFIYSAPTSAMNNNRVFRPSVPEWFRYYLLYILGALHLFMSIWTTVEYFVINWPHFKLPQFFFSIRSTIGRYFHINRYMAIPQSTCLDVNILGVSTLYMVIFLLCSILSLALYGYFYCLCLLFIISFNDILKRVLRAVTINGISLIWVAVLGVIVLFIYAVISFAFLHNNFVPSSNNGPLYCDTLGQCMYTVLRFGLLDSLGTAILFYTNTTDDTPSFEPGVFTARLLFDLSFFVIVTTIGLNIVFGIIVDSFSELREERSNIEADQKSKCFICDLSSYEFERRAKGFINHIKHDHNMWNYVYYSLYLDSIDTGDHNAIQKYVYEQIADNDTGFFPQEEARCLSGEEDTTVEKIEELQDKMESILLRFREKEHAKNVSAKRAEQQKWEEEFIKTRAMHGPQFSFRSQLSGSMEPPPVQY